MLLRCIKLFQLTAARRRLASSHSFAVFCAKFQLTAARRRLVGACADFGFYRLISTHSRPKAAGPVNTPLAVAHRYFNSQPPEGGWLTVSNPKMRPCAFQLTAARRRLAGEEGWVLNEKGISTHSRPKAAGKRLAGTRL